MRVYQFHSNNVPQHAIKLPYDSFTFLSDPLGYLLPRWMLCIISQWYWL